MKVFYFTATGNSLSVAKQLADSESQVINIATFNEKHVKDASVGIVFPVFCYDVPFIVERFLKNTKIDAEYIWAIGTCGSTAGFCFVTIDKLLKKQGSRLSYSKKIILPDSCIKFKTPLEKQPKMLNMQSDIVAKFKADINNKTVMQKPFKDSSVRVKTVAWWAMNNIFGIKNKRANDSCNKCNICVNICPVNNIKMEEKPVFSHSCENCFACIQWCPQQAIEFGKLKIDRTSKYNHPQISTAELIKRNKL